MHSIFSEVHVPLSLQKFKNPPHCGPLGEISLMVSYRTTVYTGGGGGYAARLFFFSFPCSADHERGWPPCKVVFFGLATNTLNVRNNNNFFYFQLLIPPKRFDIFSP